MELQTQAVLSFYREIGVLSKEHGVTLVQHILTKEVFVKKVLEVYDGAVFRRLKEDPLPGIPRIIELEEADGRLYVIEEYISGRTLGELLRQEGPMPENEAVSYIRRLCGILRPLHRRTPAVIHRDLKPDNLVVTYSGELMLVDFDAAKEQSFGTERDTVLMGTQGFAAPEQYGFSPSTPAADIYAMGVLLNVMLTGALPRVRLYPGALRAVIRRCTDMEPARRYQSVEELEAALDEAAGYRPPPRKRERTRPFPTDWRSWLPPGFRGTDRGVWVLAGLWYLVIIYGASAAYTEYSDPGRLILFRVWMFCILLIETLWVGNYRGIWKKLPLSRSESLPVRIAGVALWWFVWLIAAVLIELVVVGPAKL